MQMLTKPTLG